MSKTRNELKDELRRLLYGPVPMRVREGSAQLATAYKDWAHRAAVIIKQPIAADKLQFMIAEHRRLSGVD